MRLDPIYGRITRRWLEHPEELDEAFAKAWYKLLHRDMGPVSRYLGPWVPEPQLWQDPVPDGRPRADRRRGRRRAQARAARLGAVGRPAGVHRVGVGGELPRHRQARRGERGTDPPRPAEGLGRSTTRANWPRRCRPSSGSSRTSTARQSGGKKVSLADLIVLGGCAAIEQGGAQRRARHHGPVRAGPHGRLAGADRRRVVRGARTAGRRVPQLPADPATSCRRRPCWWTGRTC